MNNFRRKQIKNVIEGLSELVSEYAEQSQFEIDYNDLKDAIEWIKDDVESIAYDEEDAFDNMPESFQDSDRGWTMQENVDTLQSAESELDNAMDLCDEESNVEDITDILNNAIALLLSID